MARRDFRQFCTIQAVPLPTPALRDRCLLRKDLKWAALQTAYGVAFETLVVASQILRSSLVVMNEGLLTGAVPEAGDLEKSRQIYRGLKAVEV